MNDSIKLVSGLIQGTIADMEKGVTNFCKDGKCIGCGACCSDLLPLSDKEIKEIKRYITKNKIKPTVRLGIIAEVKRPVDLTCPFLDDSKDCEKCKIYAVRPKICRVFKCDTPPSTIKANRDNFWKNRKGYSVRELFFSESEG